MKRFVLILGVVLGSTWMVGCGGIGGLNYNWQEPGGDTQRPTDLTETTGSQNGISDSKTNIPTTDVHARLSVTKDGRYVLFTPTERKPKAKYQPSKSNSFWKGIDDFILCMDIKKNKKDGSLFPLTLRVLDLKSNKLQEHTFRMPFPRLSVVLHPDSKSVFVAEYACHYPQEKTQPPTVVLVGLHQIALDGLRTLRRYHVLDSPVNNVFHQASVHFWQGFPALPQKAGTAHFAMPSGQNRFLLSPKGGFLGFYRHAKADAPGHSLFMFNLRTEMFRRIQLASPLVQMRFSKDETALFAAANKEFDTVAQERRNRCFEKKDRDKIPECNDLKAWTDLVRINLRQNYTLDKDALMLGYSVDHYLRIQETAHGVGAMTPAFSLSPDQKTMVLSICDRVNWKRRSCSGVLFLLNTNTLTVERKIPGLGPAGFSPDGSTIVAWNGTRNQEGQVLVPLFPKDDSPYKHWLVLINTKTWQRTKVTTPFEGPLYFVTPKGNFVATVSDLQGETLLITDLDHGHSIKINAKLQLAEFSVSSTGTTLYSVEQGGVVKLDLKLASQTHLIPPGSYTENVQVLPLGSPFQRDVKLQGKSQMTATERLRDIRVSLKGEVMKPRMVPWNIVQSSFRNEGDSILVSRKARQVFEVFDEQSRLLFKHTIQP